MEMLDGVLGMLGNAWENLGTPMFGNRVNVLGSGSKTMSGFGQAHMATAAKVVLAFVSFSCVVAGTGVLARAIARNCSARAQCKAFQAKSLIPLSEGEKVPISGPMSISSRIKALFSDKVLPAAAGIAVVAGGVFIAAHANYFSRAFKK